MATPIRERLRDTTLTEHMRLESALGLPATVEVHIERLKKFYGFHAAWEPLVFPLVTPFDKVLGDRRRLPLLERDLHHFGISAEQIAALPVCHHLPMINDVPAALGSLYVMEGSTLGGQVISRHLEARLGFQAGAGYSYFAGRGSDTGKQWREFLAVLTSQASPEADAVMVEAARATFARLSDWFT